MKRYEALIRVVIYAANKQSADLVAREARDHTEFCYGGPAFVDHAELFEVREAGSQAEEVD